MIPQAFTKHDVSAAYLWIQTLPENIRSEIKSTEQMVSAYLRARRLGGAQPLSNTGAAPGAHHLPPNISGAPVSAGVASPLGGPPPPLSDADPIDPTAKSAVEFSKSLRGLKVELEQFDVAEPVGTAGSVGASNAQSHGSFHNPVHHSPGPTAAPHGQTAPGPTSAHGHPHGFAPMQSGPPGLVGALKLDAKSKEILDEIREGLNLSSDVEVLRVALVLARKKLRDILAP